MPTADFDGDRVGPVDKGDTIVSQKGLVDALRAGQEAALESVQTRIASIRHSASKAANAEFTEYRQLQEQRLNDIQSAIRSISDRLQTIATAVDSADTQQQRVEALQERQALKTEQEDLEVEREEILTEKEQGFTNKQQAIYKRHALDVTTTPIAITFVTYERGELTLEFQQEGLNTSMRLPYAIGAGVTDDVHCTNCNELLSEENTVTLVDGKLGCQQCQ